MTTAVTIAAGLSQYARYIEGRHRLQQQDKTSQGIAYMTWMGIINVHSC